MKVESQECSYCNNARHVAPQLFGCLKHFPWVDGIAPTRVLNTHLQAIVDAWNVLTPKQRDQIHFLAPKVAAALRNALSNVDSCTDKRNDFGIFAGGILEDALTKDDTG